LLEDITKAIERRGGQCLHKYGAAYNPGFMTRAVRVVGSSTIDVGIEVLRILDGNFAAYAENGTAIVGS
jgi:hypothetical protein